MVTTCPDRETLQKFLAGSSANVEAIVPHIESCITCQASLETLTSSTQSTQNLRAVVDSDSPPTAFLDKLKQHRPDSPRQEPTARPSIPGYEILEELGHGGVGIVYKARQISLNRIVAIKVLRGGERATIEERHRFRTEALAAGTLNHPGVVKVIDVGEWQPSPGAAALPYACFEFVSGGSLDRVTGRTPQPARQAADWVCQLAHAVHAAHEHKILHRDIKPANVLIDVTDGKPKITDFGLAKHLEKSGNTQTGMILGTPSYMAPEQAKGQHRVVDVRTDVYGLGAVLYELLTGRPPFQGPTALDTVVQVVEVDPILPRQLQPTVPRDLETICMTCLSKEPARRFPTAAALADDLDRFLNGQPIHAKPPSIMGRIAKWARRNHTAAVLSALLIVVVVGSLIGLTALNWRTQTARNREAAEKKIAIEERNKAVAAQDGTRKMNEFLLKHVLAAPRPTSPGKGKDVALTDVLQTAAPQIAIAFAGQPEIEASVRDSFGETFQSLGHFPEAVEQLSKALEIRNSLLGPDADETLATQHKLGRLQRFRAKYDLALPLLTDCFQRSLAKFSGDAERTLSVQLDLAYVYRYLRRFNEAAPHIETVLEASRRTLGPKHELTLLTLTAHAELMQSMGRMDVAIQSFQDGISLYESVYGPDGAQTIVHRNRLGDALLQNGRFDEAEPVLQRAYDDHCRVVGVIHPSSASLISSLAEVWEKQGQYDRSETGFRTAIDTYRKTMPADDPLVPYTQLRLGHLYLVQKRFAEAEPLMKACYDAYSQIRHIPPRRMKQCLEYLIELYTKWDRPMDAATWKAKLDQVGK